MSDSEAASLHESSSHITMNSAFSATRTQSAGNGNRCDGGIVRGIDAVNAVKRLKRRVKRSASNTTPG